MATPKVKTSSPAPRTKVSRGDKISRKLASVDMFGKFSEKNGVFHVEAYMEQPTELIGAVLRRTATHTTLRHKVTAASRRTQVSVFSNDKILELFGDENNYGSVTVLKSRKFSEATGKLNYDEDGSFTVTDASGEVTRFFPQACVTHSIYSSEDAPVVAAPKEKKGSNVVNIPAKKRNRSDDL